MSIIKPEPSVTHDRFTEVANAPPTSAPAPGLLVLTSSLHVIYMNGSASRIMAHLLQSQDKRFATGELPAQVTALCKQAAMASSTLDDAKAFERHEYGTVACSDNRPIRLHAFPIPTSEPRERDYLLVVLLAQEQVRPALVLSATDGQIKLSHREASTAQFLMEGLTNKEIGVRLGISEFTVKDHVKRLMQKTKTSTRARLIARIVVMFHTATPSASHTTPEPSNPLDEHHLPEERSWPAPMPVAAVTSV